MVAAVLVGCVLTCHSPPLAAQTDTATDRPAAESVFRAPQWGLVVRYPDRLSVSRVFKTDYFDRGQWRMSYAAGAGDGDPIVAFSLPDRRADDAGGTSEATAELTIGASRNPQSLSNCLDYGMNSGNNVVRTTRIIGGVVFTEAPDNSDGGMQQSIRSDDLRAVHEGICWAIDLRLYAGGTSNARPVFPASAIAELKRVLTGIAFAPAEPGPAQGKLPPH